MNKDNDNDKKIISRTLDRLYDSKSSPNHGFVCLLVLYFVTTFIVSTSANALSEITIFGHSLPVYSFAGVFSAVANICVILLAVYYDKKGFLCALVVLLVQIPMILMGVIFRGNLSSLPGLFANLFAIITIILIYKNNKKISSYQNKVRDMAVTDIMTGIPNGFACDELIRALIKKNERFANVCIDLNGFKDINDTMGFEAGNIVLIEIASRLKQIADEGTSGTLDFVGRTSGDEFSLMIRNFSSEDQLKATLEKYDAAISQKLNVYECDFFISAAFGYTIFPDDGNTVDAIVSHSNTAMNEVKRVNSSNHFLRFTGDLLSTEKTLETESKIRAAIENDTIFFMLQPQFDLSHKLRGFEALARMKDEKGKIISPGEFIPVAEKVGLIDKVDGIVYKKAGKFIGDLIKQTGSNISLSINVSVRHLMKNDFLTEIDNLLMSSGIPPAQLEIEITESVMIESINKAMSRINTIHDMGIMIAIDDFGTGYSSLSYLNEFPANLLKIDKSFIDKLNTGDKSKQYVAGIISLGHTMGFDVISEGVEEEEQVDTLREIGCDLIQGYIWGKPLLPEDAGKLVKG
ncbi:MAG: bifunctional diguanylate cyclase/phosphodiesterase [Lachnospiraceae bacterium]|nr:bifunctional diguanylate cyclase/phosphodiesterase [Lachnospiraceae bacterium]